MRDAGAPGFASIRNRRRRLGVAALVALVALPACSSPQGGAAVVTTIAPITSLTAAVAGEHIAVRSIVPPGQNGHTYQPRPSDLRVLRGAVLYIDNGLGLNNFLTAQAVEGLPPDTPLLMLGEVAVPAEEYIIEGTGCHGGHCHGDGPNAHVWPDPLYAAAYVDWIAKALADIDPDNAEDYADNAAALREQIEDLHVRIVRAIATIPTPNRKMVVYHNAWGYFARRYGLQLVGAIQPADFSEPSVAEVRAMIEQIRQEQVPAFFGSEVFPSKVLDAIGQETGARYIRELSDDRLPGEPGDPEHTYIGMMTANVRAVVEGLGGDPSALDTAPTGTPRR